MPRRNARFVCLFPARHRTRGRLELVSATYSRHLKSTGRVLHRPVFPRRGARRPLVRKVVPPDECCRPRARWPGNCSKTAPVSVALIRPDDVADVEPRYDGSAQGDARGHYTRGRSDDVKEGVVSFLEKPRELQEQGLGRHAPTISRGGRDERELSTARRIKARKDALRGRVVLLHGISRTSVRFARLAGGERGLWIRLR